MKQIFSNFFATLRRYKVSSTLNILGLSVAFASLYIIATQVTYEFNYNRAIPDSERVYSLQVSGLFDRDKSTICMSRPVTDLIVEGEPSVESYGALSLLEATFSIPKKSGDDQALIIKTTCLNVSESSLDILSPEIIAGSVVDFESDSTQPIMVSESFAETHSLSIGEHLNYFGQKPLKIAAIYADLPQGTDFTGVDIIRSLGDELKDKVGSFNYSHVIKFKEGATPDYEFIKRGFLRACESYPDLFDLGDKNIDELEELPFRLMPITELYFADDVMVYDFAVQGNYATTITLLVIAIVLLLIAIINFINFFFALVPIRIKSVNTHKIFGGSRSGLVVNFIAESLGLTLISMLLAAFLVYATMQTSLSEVLNAPVALADNVELSVGIIIFAVVSSILVALYPAIYITSFPAVISIKGGFAASRSGKALRYSLIGVQFVATMILFIYTALTTMQYRYLINFDLGFNKSNMITTEILPRIAANSALRGDFAKKLKENPDIVDVTFSSDEGMISSTRMTWGRNFNGVDYMLPVFTVDYSFVDVMGIEILEGRSSVASDQQAGVGAYIFNEALMQKYDLKVGGRIMGTDADSEIIGVCANYTHQHLKNSAAPLAFFIGNQSWRRLSYTYIRITPEADIEELTEYIQKCSDELSGDYTSILEFRYFDEELGITYAIERKTTTLVAFFALVSIIISLMGVFGLVLFETQFRQQEIVIRRVHGATVREILLMINRKFLLIIAICFVVAAPISYYIVEGWLATFAYHIPISAWVFVGVLAVVTIVVTSIVTVQSLKAANSNPAELIGKNA